MDPIIATIIYLVLSVVILLFESGFLYDILVTAFFIYWLGLQDYEEKEYIFPFIAIIAFFILWSYAVISIYSFILYVLLLIIIAIIIGLIIIIKKKKH